MSHHTKEDVEVDANGKISAQEEEEEEEEDQRKDQEEDQGDHQVKKDQDEEQQSEQLQQQKQIIKKRNNRSSSKYIQNKKRITIYTGFIANSILLLGYIFLILFELFDLRGRARERIAIIYYFIAFFLIVVSGFIELCIDLLISGKGRPLGHGRYNYYTYKSRYSHKPNATRKSDNNNSNNSNNTNNNNNNNTNNNKQLFTNSFLCNIIISILFLLGGILDIIAFIFWMRRNKYIEELILLISSCTMFCMAFFIIYCQINILLKTRRTSISRIKKNLQFYDLIANIIILFVVLLSIIERSFHVSSIDPVSSSNVILLFKRIKFTTSPIWLLSSIVYVMTDIIRIYYQSELILVD